MQEFPWAMTLTIIGVLLSLIGSLIIYNLGCISKKLSAINIRLDQQDGRIQDIDRRFTGCKIECSQTTVTKEDWVRSEALTRNKLDAVACTLARMDGKLEVVEKLPAIAGAIAKEIAGELKQKG
ncbi:MAG: hypothetical protein WC877_03280 [Dehalococcoidales bacterium]|jgi:hypothetical protein|nr:type I-F CRISPR-associated protein Csy2 [Candidatus Neomarinimicrobiota bacterium]